ncbi:MAG: segregation/condensation protein A [bacterium]|nr:segregation/condensation protein A [bacterium]
METQNYTIHTETFDGPLDLLLHLIKKNKMDIMNIKLSEITAEYLYYLKDRSMVNPSREGDFLMTASTLIYIKSRSLLPKPELLQEESPEDKLLHTLIEYEKIQKISKMLKEKEGQTLLLWKREEVEDSFESKDIQLTEVSSFQLAEVFMKIVGKKDKEEFLYIDSKEYSIEKKWDEIQEAMKSDGFLDFDKYIAGLDNLQEILVSFFTILEMMKQKIIMGVQKELFAPISLWIQERSKEEINAPLLEDDPDASPDWESTGAFDSLMDIGSDGPEVIQ